MGQMEKQIAIKKLPALTFLGQKKKKKNFQKGITPQAFKIWSTNSLHHPHQIVRNSKMFTGIRLMEKTANTLVFLCKLGVLF